MSLNFPNLEAGCSHLRWRLEPSQTRTSSDHTTSTPHKSWKSSPTEKLRSISKSAIPFHLSYHSSAITSTGHHGVTIIRRGHLDGRSYIEPIHHHTADSLIARPTPLSSHVSHQHRRSHRCHASHTKEQPPCCRQTSFPANFRGDPRSSEGKCGASSN